MWLILRLVMVIGAAWGLASISPASSNLNWTGCILIALATGIGLYLWLIVVGNKQELDWPHLFSMTMPFYPMDRYPLRFWVISAISLITGGIIAILKSLVSGSSHLATGSTFLSMGIVILLTLIIVRRSILSKK